VPARAQSPRTTGPVAVDLSRSAPGLGATPQPTRCDGAHGPATRRLPAGRASRQARDATRRHAGPPGRGGSFADRRTDRAGGRRGVRRLHTESTRNLTTAADRGKRSRAPGASRAVSPGVIVLTPAREPGSKRHGDQQGKTMKFQADEIVSVLQREIEEFEAQA